MKLRDFLLYKFFPPLAKFYINLVGRTSRVRVVNKEYFTGLAAKGKPVIFAVWHENIVMSPYLYHTAVGGDKLVAMVSRSGDGEIIAKVLEQFGAVSVRGSSSRGAVPALLQMADKIQKEGKDGVMMVDGPRGPALKMQPGAIKLAQLTGAPIIPCGVATRRHLRLKSWDRLKIPRPFNRVTLVFGLPISVPKDTPESAIESLRQNCESALITCCRQADKDVD